MHYAMFTNGTAAFNFHLDEMTPRLDSTYIRTVNVNIAYICY
jgi:hypothetical protein